MKFPTPKKGPAKQGLYDPSYEHDACGIGAVVHIKGLKSHSIVRQGLEVLVNLDHRGARGAEVCTGDGAGILIQMPHEFFSAVAPEDGITLPEPGAYAVGMVYLSPDDAAARRATKNASQKSSPKKARPFSAGAPCRPITPNSARRRFRLNLLCVNFSSDAATKSRKSRNPTLWFSSANFTSSASAPNTKSSTKTRPAASIFTCPACRLAPSSIKECSRRIRWIPIILTSATSAWFRRLPLVHSRFSTNTFPVVGSLASVSFHHSQRRNQHAARQRQLDARAPGASRHRGFRRRFAEDFPDCGQRFQRFGRVRQRAGISLSRRTPAGARGDDDDSGAVGQARKHERRQARVL